MIIISEICVQSHILFSAVFLYHERGFVRSWHVHWGQCFFVHCSNDTGIFDCVVLLCRVRVPFPNASCTRWGVWIVLSLIWILYQLLRGAHQWFASSWYNQHLGKNLVVEEYGKYFINNKYGRDRLDNETALIIMDSKPSSNVQYYDTYWVVEFIAEYGDEPLRLVARIDAMDCNVIKVETFDSWFFNNFFIYSPLTHRNSMG